MQHFQLVAEANKPNGANKPQGCRGAEDARKIRKKSNSPNNRNSAPGYTSTPRSFLLQRLLGLLGLLYIYLIYTVTYVKNPSAVTGWALRLLAVQGRKEGCHV